MNIDQFKSILISSMAQSGLQWSEDEQYSGEGSLLTTAFTLPRYRDDCTVQLLITEDYLSVSFILDRIVPTYDNLKLINDFNANVEFLSASIIRMGRDAQPFLVLKGSLFVIESPEAGVQFVGKTLNYILSDSVSPFLRPLTIITE